MNHTHMHKDRISGKKEVQTPCADNRHTSAAPCLEAGQEGTVSGCDQSEARASVELEWHGQSLNKGRSQRHSP